MHGCLQELLALVTGPLGYMVEEVARPSGRRGFTVSHPEGRRLVSLGDLVDRGPDSPGVLAFWMDACADGAALAVKGNHDQKLLRHLRGGEVSMAHGFDRTVAQLADTPEQDLADYRAFIDGLTSHLVLDGGALAVAHAGVKAEMQTKAGRLVSDFCLYGETTGELDEFGLPVRHDWAADYAGKAAVVYGHTPVPEAQWVGNTICIDTGCVFGGKLTALRWPEREAVSVPATRVHYEPVRPMLPPAARSPSSLPDAAALTGKAMIETRYGRAVSIQPEQAAAAFEILARFAADPRWLIHVPPTTATVEASAAEGWLERPEEAFRHYRAAGLAGVCVQEKHMGSRAVAIACRDADIARQRFGDGTRMGAVLSKGGRPFFDDPADEAFLVDAIRAAMDASGMWDELRTGWVTLDGEALPWNAKAGSLIRDTFAATASAGAEAARAAANAYGAAAARGSEVAAALATQASAQGAALDAFRHAYGVFVVPYSGIDDLRFAPFHVLASEAGVHGSESHGWHMEIAERLAVRSNVIVPTEWRDVTLADTAQCEAAALWWDEMTEAGREGFVVKGPHLALLPNGVAPAIKVRGKEYLRIIYGAEYDRPDILPALKHRATGRKRTLARIGTSLGLESLARFVERASASRVHEVVAASLAVASEPLDSRL
jgi:protein phosphatase